MCGASHSTATPATSSARRLIPRERAEAGQASGLCSRGRLAVAAATMARDLRRAGRGPLAPPRRAALRAGARRGCADLGGGLTFARGRIRMSRFA